MAAHLQPTEADIDAFLSIAGPVDRMEGNNNNVQQAINEYFDRDPYAPNKYRWDEEQFSSDRDGAYQNHGISFDIQGPDEPGPFHQFDGAPSRPPSRTSQNKSPIGKAVDGTANDVPGDSRTVLVNDEDRDLQQALAASREEAGLPPQESGVTHASTDDVHFGPANRPQYEQGKWDMVAVEKTTTQEMMLDPEPAERRRESGVPAFLKPSIDDNRLGALITIYHEIPLLREVFLARIETLSNYGYDKEWWTGQRIELPMIESDELDTNHEVLQELQRLMAFLDKTQRSYGSADALANLPSVRKFLRRGGDLESAVFRAWAKIYQDNSQAPIRKVFSWGEKPSSNPDNVETQDFAILELSLPLKESPNETLYDVADEALWGDPPTLDLSESAYLSHIADVISFRLEGDEFKKGIEVPAVWYPDRYLKSGSEAALEMRRQKLEVDLELRNFHHKEHLLTEYLIRGKAHKVKDLFDVAIQHDQAEVGASIQLNGDDSNHTESSEHRPLTALDISAELRRVMDSIDQKLLALNVEKEKARGALRDLSLLYTESSTPETTLHKYTLRGVSITKSTMYVCRSGKQDVTEMGVESINAGSSADQWWRIQYAPTGPRAFSVEKSTIESVLQAVKSENRSVLLVYASTKAMEWSSNPLPSALEAFVRTDNEAFQAELFASTENKSATESPRSPGKRKYDERSEQDAEQTERNGRASPKKQNETLSIYDNEPNGQGYYDMSAPRTASRSLADLMAEDSRMAYDHGQHEVLVGMDPAVLAKEGNASGNMSEGQEMQERGNSLRMLVGRAGDAELAKGMGGKADSMDLNGVLEDEDVTEASAAVNHIGFTP